MLFLEFIFGRHMVKISVSNIQKVNSQAEVQNALIPDIYHLVLTNTMKKFMTC